MPVTIGPKASYWAMHRIAATGTQLTARWAARLLGCTLYGVQNAVTCKWWRRLDDWLLVDQQLVEARG